MFSFEIVLGLVWFDVLVFEFEFGVWRLILVSWDRFGFVFVFRFGLGFVFGLCLDSVFWLLFGV